MERKEIEITKKDLRRSFLRWYMSAEISNSFERLQSVSFCYSMIPVLRKSVSYTHLDVYKRQAVMILSFRKKIAVMQSILRGSYFLFYIR